jgi:hypothetical protein
MPYATGSYKWHGYRDATEQTPWTFTPSAPAYGLTTYGGDVQERKVIQRWDPLQEVHDVESFSLKGSLIKDDSESYTLLASLALEYTETFSLRSTLIKPEVATMKLLAFPKLTQDQLNVKAFKVELENQRLKRMLLALTAYIMVIED